MPRHRFNSRRTFEKLEDRRMMVAGILFSGGTLTIEGDNTDNEVEVRFEGNQVHIDLTYDDGDDDAQLSRSISTVTEIVFNGFEGDDELTVDVRSLNAGVTLDNVVLKFNGDEDNDTLNNDLQGGVRVEAYGDEGRDILQGSKYGDLFEGGTGDDDFHGARGDDTYIFAGIGLGTDAILDEAADVNIDTLDFTDFGERVSVSLYSVYSTSSGYYAVDNSNLQLKLFDSLAIEDVIGTDYGDYLAGNKRPNHLMGRGDNDSLLGEDGDDTLEGGAGDDTYHMGWHQGTAEIIEADNADKDLLSFLGVPIGVTVDLTKFGTNYAVNNDRLKVKLSNDTAIEDVMGTYFRDIIIGNSRNNRIMGLDGNDTISGGLGDDTLEGRADNDTYVFAGSNLGTDTIIEAANTGTDTLDFSGMSTGVTVDISRFGTAYAVDSANFKLKLSNDTAIENVNGSDYNDRITGNNRDNKLYGGRGRDEIRGGFGADRLDGGADNDILWSDVFDEVYGGSGYDTFDDYEEATLPFNPRPWSYKDWRRF